MSAMIRESIKSLESELRQWRRDFHRHPETGFKEFRTSRVIAQLLDEWGFELRRDVAETGLVAVSRGRGSADELPCIAFRCDMDALPLDELSTHDYKSEEPGIMHACGHDGHMAIMLGFAKWLASHRGKIPGHVKLIFQPAEEGLGGAQRMIAEGALDNPPVDNIVGMHLWNNLEVGKAGVRPGPLMASVDMFSILIKGKGGHGAMPQQTADAVIMAGQVITALQTVVSRKTDPRHPVVVTIGQVHAGTAPNIIAESAMLEGTARTFDPETRKILPQLIQHTADSVARAFGGRAELKWLSSYPATISDEKVAAMVAGAAGEVLGFENIVDDETTMASEDMSYFLQKVPGCYFFLGSANSEKGLDEPHHSPRFDFDERALLLGVELFARCTEDFFAKL